MKKLLQKIFLSITLLLGLSMNILAQSGANDPTFNTFDNGTFGDGSGFNLHVITARIQSDDKIIVGGNFTYYNGTSRKNIVRLNSNGSLDTTFNPGTGFNLNNDISNVNTISIQSDGKIVVGGKFTTFNGITSNHIVRLNSNGSLDTTFNQGTGVSVYGSVCTTSIQSDGKIIVGGDFYGYNGIARNYIVRLNSNGSLDATFNPGTMINGAVNTTSIQSDGKIIVGGAFTTFSGTSKNRIVRLNSDGSLDTTFNPGAGFDKYVTNTNIQSDGKIIVVGLFSTYNNTARKGIARLNSDGSLDAGFNVGSGFYSSDYSNYFVNNTSIQSNGKIIVGGAFDSFNGMIKKRIVRLNSDGSLDTTFNLGAEINGEVLNTSIQSDGKIIVGGNFTHYNGTSRKNIVRLNSNGSLDTTFNPGTGLNDAVSTINIQTDGKIIVGGDFTSFNGVSRKKIARLNNDGTLDPTFNIGTGFNNVVLTISIQTDGKIIVGGDFTSFNGVSRKKIARLNNDGTLDPTFNIGTGFNYCVQSINIQTDGKIIVGGWFTTFNGTARNNIARLNSDGTLDTSFNPGLGFDNWVRTTCIQTDGKIIVGGDFTSFNGTARNKIVRLNSDGSLDASFNPGTGFNNNYVFTTRIQTDGKVIVGGSFTSFNGISRNCIARLNSDGSLDAGFNLGTGFDLGISNVSLQSDSMIVVGGDFSSFNGTARNKIARLNSDGTLDTTFNQGTGFYGVVLATSIQPDGKIIVGGNFAFYNGINRTRIARLLKCDNPSFSVQNASACNSYTLNGQTYTTSGTYTQTLVNTAGCDSIITLNLTILNSVNTLTTSACNSYTLNGQTYTTSGTYTQTLVNTAGCDSTITLNLTINKVTDISTSVSGVTITANNNSASYLWLNCDNNFAPISGATGQSFTATSNGNYAVQLTQNGCVDTSACVAITTIGVIENSFLDNLRVYPNPTDGIIHIDFGKEQETLSISLYTLNGQLLENKSYKTSSFIKFEVNAPSGVYLLKISDSDNQEALIRIMKK